MTPIRYLFKRVFWVLFSVLFLSIPLLSSEESLSLDTCIRLALDNNPILQVSEEERKHALSQYRLTTARNNIGIEGHIKTIERLSSEDTSTGVVRVPGVDTDIGLFTGVTVSYLLYDGKRKGTEEAARMTVDLSRLNIQKQKRDMVFNVKKAYYEYLLARDIMEFQKRLLGNIQEKLEKMRRLYRLGQRPILDVSRTEVKYSENLMNYEEAENQAAFKRRQLFSAMGIPPQDVEIEVPDKGKLPEVRYNEDELFRFAEIFSPALQVFEVKKRIQRKKVEIEKAGRYPSVALHFALGVENSKLYGFEDIQENFYPSNWAPVFTWTFEAKVPIYHGGAIGAKIDSAKANFNRMVYEEKDVRLNLKNMIANNLQALNNLKNRISLSEKMISDTEKHLLLATRSYESGVASQFDLQEAERGILTAKIAHVKARYTYMMTLATLANIIGVDEERICRR